MDERGHWHNADDRLAEKFSEAMQRDREGGSGNDRPRFVIACDIGECVAVVKADGQSVMATFDAAIKNKVTLTPKPAGEPIPYLELAERVTLERSSGESVAAQVWDNRRGKIILRTLPVGG